MIRITKNCLKYFILITILIGVQGANFETRPPFFAQKYSEIGAPRGLLVDPTGDILVLSKSSSAIIALYETKIENEETVRVNQVLIVNAEGLELNHGITYKDNFIYASSISTVYRWPYQPGQRRLVEEDAEIVIRDIRPNGHNTRTILFDEEERFYVQQGSENYGDNFDWDSNESIIRRFEKFTQVPPGGFNFTDGEVFAYGVRNSVGLDFDSSGILWGVENGISRIDRPDLGNIDMMDRYNPSEEINRLDGPPGTNYGFPYCWGTHTLEGYPEGTQFAYPAFLTDGIHTDEWCRNPENNRPPILNMEAHQAPLGLQFYRGQGCELGDGAFSCSMIGDMFVANHGSSVKEYGTGYNVQYYEVNKTTLLPTGPPVNVIYSSNIIDCDGPCFRPVNVVFNNVGHMIVSSDNSNEIFRICYASVPPPVIYNRIF